MKKIYLLFVLLSVFSCKKTNPEVLSFILLDDFTLDGSSIFDGKEVYYYGEKYIVKGYFPSDYNISVLDSFACTRYQARTKNHSSFIVTFYKHSKRTNVKELKKYERELARYSDMHDKLYEYSVLRFGDKTNKERYKMHKRIRTEKKDFVCDG